MSVRDLFRTSNYNTSVVSLIQSSQAERIEEVRAAATSLLEENHPKLKGAILVSIQQNHMRFNFTFVHPGLPPVAPGSSPPVRPLIPRMAYSDGSVLVAEQEEVNSGEHITYRFVPPDGKMSEV